MEFTVKMVQLFDALGELIVSCFSFLPAWSLLFAGSAIGLIVGIAVFKFVRG